MQISSIQNRLVSPANIVQEKKMSHSSLSLKNGLNADTFQRQGAGKVSFKGDGTTGTIAGATAGGLAGAFVAAAIGGPVGAAAYLVAVAAGAKIGKEIDEKL